MQATRGRRGDTIKTEIAAAQDNLDHLTGVKSKSLGDASAIVTRARMFKLTRFMQGTETTEFFLLLTSDGESKTLKVQEVKFVSGSEKMKLQGKQLKTSIFPPQARIPRVLCDAGFWDVMSTAVARSSYSIPWLLPRSTKPANEFCY
jgi:hypothetical protein